MTLQACFTRVFEYSLAGAKKVIHLLFKLCLRGGQSPEIHFTNLLVVPMKDPRGNHVSQVAKKPPKLKTVSFLLFPSTTY